MKTLAALAAVLFAASHLCAQAQSTTTTNTTTAGTTATNTTATDTTSTQAKATDQKVVPPAKAPAKKEVKKEEEPKIPGEKILRANGTYLGLEIADGRFKLSFYDKKKKPMPMDVTRATARWPNTRSATKAFNRTVLNPAGSNYLLGSNPAVPPFVGNIFITLLQGDGDDAKAVENYSVSFHN